MASRTRVPDHAVGKLMVVGLWLGGLYASVAWLPPATEPGLWLVRHPMWAVGFVLTLAVALAVWSSGGLGRVKRMPATVWALLGTVSATLLSRLLPDGVYATGGFIGGLFAFLIFFSVRLMVIESLRSRGSVESDVMEPSGSPDGAESGMNGEPPSNPASYVDDADFWERE